MANTTYHLADFAIITALLEERDALLAEFPKGVEVTDEIAVYYRLHLPLDSNLNDGYCVVITCLARMGPLEAAIATEKLISRWNPRHILMVGIAGSLHSDVRLCDVVGSSDVIDYDPGKVTDKGARYRPRGYPANALLLSRLQALTARPTFVDWQRECNKRIKRLKVNLPTPQLHFGTIACGSLVIASAKKKTELAAIHQKFCACEMESGGVMAAVFSRADATRCMTIRGVSDAADASKSDLDDIKAYRLIAVENAASLTRRFLASGPDKASGVDRFECELTLASASMARRELEPVKGGSHLAFPAAIKPDGPLTELLLDFRVRDKHDELIDIVQCVVRYVDTKGQRVRQEVPIGRSRGIRTMLQDVGPFPVELFAATATEAHSATLNARTLLARRAADWKAIPMRKGR